MPNNFAIDDQLTELQTETDIPRIYKEESFLEKRRDKYVFKEALQAVGRIDLVVKLEKYLTTYK